jgi:opacity protein-like surface antigen
MKKLIAISVVFALVAGAAFAADISVDVIGKVDLVAGDTAKYDAAGEKEPVKAGGLTRRMRMSASGENDDGTFGGWIRFEPNWNVTPGSNPNQGQPIGAWANAWWKPVEQVKILLGGSGGDGFFGADGVARWGFYGPASDTDVVHESWKFSDSFYGGWAKNGLVLTLTPIEPLEINVAIPYMENDHMWGDDMMAVYKESTLQVAYNAEGLGKFALTFALGKGVDEKKGWAESPGALWLFAGLTMIENLEIDIGLGYVLPYAETVTIDNPLDPDDPFVGKTTHTAPIAAGVAAHYNGGDFGVKARVQAKLAGKETPEGGEAVATPLNLVFDALPYYNISDSLCFLFSVGVDFTAAPKKIEGQPDPVSVIGWHAEPYITIKGGSNWFPNFYAGIRIETSGVKDSGKAGEDPVANTHWSVPIGIAFAF